MTMDLLVMCSAGYVFHYPDDMYHHLYYFLLTWPISHRHAAVHHQYWAISHWKCRQHTYVSQFYGSDVQAECAKLHQDVLVDTARQRNEPAIRTHGNVVQTIRGEKGEHPRGLIPEIAPLVKFALTEPVTSCTPERSFSCLRRVGTYLRSTMGQARLNHCFSSWTQRP